MIDFEALEELLDASPIATPQSDDYAEFVDETDENQGVVIRRKDGTPVMWVPLDVYLSVRETVAISEGKMP